MGHDTKATHVVGEAGPRLRRMVEQVPAVLWCTDCDLRITEALGAGLAAFGLRPDQAAGMTLEQFFHADGPGSPPIAAHRRALRGRSISFRQVWDGRTHEARVAPLWGDEDRIVGCVGFAQQIAGQRQSQEAPRKSHAELERQLGKRAKEMKCLYDISYVVEGPGITLEEICQRTVDLIPPAWQYPEITCARILVDDQEYRTENFSETSWKQASEIFLHGKRIGTVEVCYLEEKEECDEGPFLKEERSLLDAIAERLGRVAERFKTEHALREAERSLRIGHRIAEIFLTVHDDAMYGEALQVVLEALESRHGTFGYIDEEGTLVILSSTRDVWDQCGIPDKGIIWPRDKWGGIWGRALTEKKTFYSNEPARGPKVHIPIQRSIATPIVHREEVIGLLHVANKTTDYDQGDARLLETIAARVAPILDARRGRDKLAAARKRAAQERKRLIAELEAKNAELERFTYTVSHDLKSPLITIQGFLGQLEQDAITGKTDRIKGDVARIRNAAESMHEFLDELLELSRIGRVAKPAEEISLASLAREAVSLLAGPIAERGARVEIPPDLPVVFGDRRRLVEVLQNLIENAVKFMGDQPEPRVEIGARNDGDETVCYVRDNGTGIDPRYHERVFDLFEQLDPQQEGTGVGLALVKRIIEVHGGRIWVESEGQGQGCTFCFTLPRKGETTTHAE